MMAAMMHNSSNTLMDFVSGSAVLFAGWSIKPPDTSPVLHIQPCDLFDLCG